MISRNAHGAPEPDGQTRLGGVYAAIRQQARKEALEEAAKLCEGLGRRREPNDCAAAIRSLIDRSSPLPPAR